MTEMSNYDKAMSKLADLHRLSMDEGRVRMRIAYLNNLRDETTKKLLSESSTIQAIETELEGLLPERAKLEYEVKKAENAAKAAGKELYLSSDDPDVLKDELGGILQARKTEKFVVDNFRALDWVRSEAHGLDADTFRSVVKLDRKGLEKIAKRFGPQYGSTPLSEVAKWEDGVTIALQKRKLAEWVPPIDNTDTIVEEEAVASAVDRLQEAIDQDATVSGNFLDKPIEAIGE